MFQSLTQLAESYLQIQYEFLQVLAILYGSLAIAASLLCFGGLAVQLLSGSRKHRHERTAVAAPDARTALPRLELSGLFRKLGNSDSAVS